MNDFPTEKSKTYLQLYMASYVLMLGIIVLFIALSSHFTSGINLDTVFPNLFPTLSFVLSIYMLVTLVLALLFWGRNKKSLIWLIAICMLNGVSSFFSAVAVETLSVTSSGVMAIIGPQPVLFLYGSRGLGLNIPVIILFPIWIVLVVWGFVHLTKKT